MREKQGHHSHRLAVFGAVFLITILLILYSSKSENETYRAFKPAVFPSKTRIADLKKMAGKEGYVSIFGNKNMTLHYNQCALVTSSSHVLSSGAGAEIDRADCVIRMNDAPTSGFEADVGNRTSLRVVAHSSVFHLIRKPQEFLNCTEGVSIIFWGPASKIGSSKSALYKLIQRVASTYSNLSAFTVTPNKMHKFDDLFHKETGWDRKKSRSWLSTGWFTMVIAIEICDNIKVYGMVPPNHCGKRIQSKRMPYHYYKPRGSDECVTYLQHEKSRGNHHRYITEKKVFAHWAKLYNITFLHPTW